MEMGWTTLEVEPELSSTSSEKKEDIANRNYGQQSAPQIQQHQNQQCCCIPQQQQCLQNQHFTQGDDLVGEVCVSLQKKSKINRRYLQGLINERIVNRPGAAGQQTLSCASGQRICCYDDHPEVRTKNTTKNILNYWPYDNYCLVPRTLTTTSACSSGTQVAASRSHPPLLSSLLVDGSRSGQTLLPFLVKLIACCSFMFLVGTTIYFSSQMLSLGLQ